MKRLLLLSDIHASDVDPSSASAPSYVSSFSAAASAKTDPIADLSRLLHDEGLSADYVLCAGDMTNRSHPPSFTYVWQRLNHLAQQLNAKLISTVGNHDLDSRYQANKFDPRGYAMTLEPTIPVPERERFLEYWAENFTLIAEPELDLLVLNTAAYHGGGESVAEEIEHGRISAVTLAGIQQTIAAAPKAPTNILLCHHHPMKAEQGDQELAGQTRGGEKLVQALGDAAQGWIIIHGHKHVPDLFYGHGGANAPVILGCASFSAQVNADAQNKNPNQVHLLLSDPDAAVREGLTIAGSVLSWTWQPGVGWNRSQGTYGLPYYSGFGHRGSVRVLADQVEAHLSSIGVNHMTWGEALSAIPLLQRLIPGDFAALERLFSERGLSLLRDRDGSIAQVGRAT
jgi:predicted phosphodiesterase